MIYLTSISLIIGYSLIFCQTFITVFYIIKYRKKYGTELIAYLNLATVFNSGIILSTTLLLSVAFYFSTIINLILWKISVISYLVSLIITLLIYSFFKEYRKIQIIPILIISILFGLIIGSVILPGSIIIFIDFPSSTPFSLIDISTINYYYNFFTGIFIIILQVSITIYLIYIPIFINLKYNKSEESLPLFLITIIFISLTIFCTLYILFQNTIFRELFIILLWITIFRLDMNLILKPEMFFILPNEVYSINIYHKSGVLLYSYNFKKKSKTVNNSKIWGNIIIGLNHILSEFIEKSDKIDVIQTRKVDIVVNYNNEYGFAVVVVTNKKNAILEKFVREFSQEFKSFYKNELNEIQDLNRLINVSDFTDARQIIEKNFQLYL